MIALQTLVRVPRHHATRRESQCAGRALIDTLAAVDARVDRVGVVTRQAVEGAPLQEDDEAVAGAVDRRELEGVSDQAAERAHGLLSLIHI